MNPPTADNAPRRPLAFHCRLEAGFPIGHRFLFDKAAVRQLRQVVTHAHEALDDAVVRRQLGVIDRPLAARV
ncbi:hypothetical protein [Lysobacter sp. GCM10012299]|uniref:hypothetical protein n=1 Tax=Lysobacter sp. GCM10012299 TaxID=3317333 RepID=UPI0036157E12